MLLDDTIAGNNYNGQNWAFQIKNMLNDLGFSHVWNNQEQNDIPFNEIKQRIIDQANQEILMANTTSSKLETYCLFKLDTSCESYLNKYKFALSRFRLIMRQSACLVLNPITVYSYGFLFNCTRVGQASDSMTALT